MQSLKIAVIGSGISGLSSAWLLDQKHDVTLFEADNRLGGHTNTFDMDIDGKTVPVDTGFICFNEQTYPNLTALFKHLDVPIHPTDMNFAASMASGQYEYAGGTYTGLIGQPANLFRMSHWRMVRDILRFFKEATRDLDTLDDDESLASYLARKGYSDAFVDLHLLPMAAAIWSSKLEDMTTYPAKSFIRFFQNHGLLQVYGRPRWGTVNGGSKVYIERLLATSNFKTRLGAPVVEILRRPDGVMVKTAGGEAEKFDQIVIASHGDQALAMLGDPSAEEREILGAFHYAKNHAVLHRDRRLMPKRRLTWASWNYLDFAPSMDRTRDEERDLCVTYWMNSLQNLPTREQVFVTLNPSPGIKIDHVAARFDYTHPIFDADAMNAQREIWSLQGVNRTWFCGAHFGAGFHEDGLQSGLAVAEQLGGLRRPWADGADTNWDIERESSRIHVWDSVEQREAAE
ncbi:MAG: FAD-dependent oxidoreductase [Pseudomonadota bacterium]